MVELIKIVLKVQQKNTNTNKNRFRIWKKGGMFHKRNKEDFTIEYLIIIEFTSSKI